MVLHANLLPRVERRKKLRNIQRNALHAHMTLLLKKKKKKTTRSWAKSELFLHRVTRCAEVFRLEDESYQLDSDQFWLGHGNRPVFRATQDTTQNCKQKKKNHLPYAQTAHPYHKRGWNLPHNELWKKTMSTRSEKPTVFRTTVSQCRRAVRKYHQDLTIAPLSGEAARHQTITSMVVCARFGWQVYFWGEGGGGGSYDNDDDGSVTKISRFSARPKMNTYVKIHEERWKTEGKPCAAMWIVQASRFVLTDHSIQQIVSLFHCGGNALWRFWVVLDGERRIKRSTLSDVVTAANQVEVDALRDDRVLLVVRVILHEVTNPARCCEKLTWKQQETILWFTRPHIWRLGSEVFLISSFKRTFYTTALPEARLLMKLRYCRIVQDVSISTSSMSFRYSFIRGTNPGNSPSWNGEMCSGTVSHTRSLTTQSGKTKLRTIAYFSIDDLIHTHFSVFLITVLANGTTLLSHRGRTLWKSQHGQNSLEWVSTGNGVWGNKCAEKPRDPVTRSRSRDQPMSWQGGKGSLGRFRGLWNDDSGWGSKSWPWGVRLSWGVPEFRPAQGVVFWSIKNFNCRTSRLVP